MKYILLVALLGGVLLRLLINWIQSKTEHEKKIEEEEYFFPQKNESTQSDAEIKIPDYNNQLFENEWTLNFPKTINLETQEYVEEFWDFSKQIPVKIKTRRLKLRPGMIGYIDVEKQTITTATSNFRRLHLPLQPHHPFYHEHHHPTAVSGRSC